MIFTTLYALASAVGFVVDLADHNWFGMLCVLAYSGIAYRCGEELVFLLRNKGFNRKFGRALMGILFGIAAFWLARNHALHLVYVTITGQLWVVVGIAVGLVANLGSGKKI